MSYLILCGSEHHDGSRAQRYVARSYRDALDVAADEATQAQARGETVDEPIHHHPLCGLSVEGWLTCDLDAAKEIARKATAAAVYVVDPV